MLVTLVGAAFSTGSGYFRQRGRGMLGTGHIGSSTLTVLFRNQQLGMPGAFGAYQGTMGYAIVVADFTTKERQRLAELHQRLKGGTFTETDVSALLVLIREKAGGGPILELAHSIAHSERNSGEFFRRIRSNQSLLNDLGKRSGKIDARYVFSATDFSTHFNSLLCRHGFEKLDDPIGNLVFLCALSLLQDSSVRGGKTFGELHLSATSEHFELRAEMPIDHDGKTVRATFPLAAMGNRWLPICNPRASIDAPGPVTVSVENFVPLIEGFKVFELYVERAEPIEASDLTTLMEIEPRLRRTADGLVYRSTEGQPMFLRYEGGRLTAPGRPEFLRGGSECEAVLKTIHRTLGGCVHDDAGAHWFLPLPLAPDGLHCHWVGRGAPTCIRPL